MLHGCYLRNKACMIHTTASSYFLHNSYIQKRREVWWKKQRRDFAFKIIQKKAMWLATTFSYSSLSRSHPALYISTKFKNTKRKGEPKKQKKRNRKKKGTRNHTQRDPQSTPPSIQRNSNTIEASRNLHRVLGSFSPLQTQLFSTPQIYPEDSIPMS